MDFSILPRTHPNERYLRFIYFSYSVFITWHDTLADQEDDLMTYLSIHAKEARHYTGDAGCCDAPMDR